MGKSPGKWIKAKLFGKKSTKSTVSARGNGGKEAFIVSKVSSGIVASNDPVISSPQLVSVYKNGQKVESGDRRDVMPPQESNTFVSGSQDAGVKSTGSTPEDESDVLKKEQAAAKVQAALRGFLARRAFRALKGIIRLQALMRGHLVRRQAHATLHCLQGIIKVQALVRGQKVRLSEAGIEVKHKCNLEKLKLDTVGALKSIFPEKLPKNMYARKLLASSSKAKPLALHYDSCDVNSAWKWLERWSLSYFWELVVEPKRDTGSKTFSKSGSSRGGEMKNGRPKRSNLKNSAIHDNSSEYGNPRGTLKKYTTRQANGHNDLDKVKPNPRKVSSTKSDSDKKPEGAFDKPKSKTPKMCIRENLLVVPVQGSSKSVEKHQDSTDLISIKKPSESAKTLMAVEDIGLFDAIAKESELTIDVSLVVEKLENSGLQQSILTDHENSPVVVEEMHSKEDSSIKDKENLKTRRRKSLSAKHDYSENESQNSQTLPSYMQATKSAKAKLKAQVSPRLSQEYSENGVVRRHSLPSSTGEKLITPSPRIQKLVQARSKGDKSLSASKDYNNNDSVGGLMFMKTSMSFSEVNHHHHGFDEEEGLVNQEDEFSEDYGGGSSLSGEKKKRLKREQVRELERSFELGNKLDSARKQQLAKSLGLLKKQFASTMADNDKLGSFHYEVYLSVACTDFLLHSMNLFPSLSRPATGPHFLETSLRSNPQPSRINQDIPQDDGLCNILCGVDDQTTDVWSWAD